MGNRLIVRRAAVLGAGVMGAQIAAHFVNQGIPVLLFDLPSEGGDRRRIAVAAIERLKKARPAPLASPSRADWIQAADYETDMALLSGCELVIEAIAERMDWKRDLYRRIAPHLHPQAVLASNTSGLSLTALSLELPEAVRSRFCGLHFFNPPRYMSLVELIPTPHTEPALLDRLEAFATSALGKRVVRAMDTPNFVANRIGVAGMLFTLIEAERFGLTFDVVDDLTGRKLGRASSGTYRTADVVGLDTLAHVVRTLQEQLPEDPFHDAFATPPLVARLIEAGALGSKSGAGFFKKVGRDILRLDPATFDYVASGAKAAPEVAALLKQAPAERLAALRASDHPQARFLWAIQRDLFHYCAVHLADVAHAARDMDFALRWGYGWQEGPFETWQRAGWSTVARWIQEDIDAGQALAPVPLPPWVFDGRDGVHKGQGSWDAAQGSDRPVSTLPVYRRQLFPEGVAGNTAADPRTAGKTLFEDEFIRAWTLDDEFLIATLRTKMRTFNSGALKGLLQAVALAESDFRGLVLWGPGEPFSAGGDLTGFLSIYAHEGLDGFGAEQRRFQDAMQALRHAAVPTVAASRGYALGGGCETFLHCTRRVAHLETQAGLVEVNVGLLPGAGGLTTLARLAGERAQRLGFPLDVAGQLKDDFVRVMRAQIFANAQEAREAGWMGEGDVIVAHPEELLFVALSEARALADAAYRPPLPARFPVAGREGKAVLVSLLVNYRNAGQLTDYDVVIGTAIADVLCGGDVHAGTLLGEASLLALERKHFCELMAHAKTRERIQALLDTGKPLRN
ncbi:MAG: 3-hydroxyacyl-CoA dehydrogenase/enoyl-CoA hydratase family protein [Betaproteobacteria bacterium]|nr:3-hydroxyacyl-CoA dehydrogenase/enoyl-CoA hydratase family protein [Betaproteobacteria bacterium]MDE2211106.1 3-hydroxyacyl-CoA dehydrogenase/enoyl-CoA hydratase family protein [Betaproteobacteria bacterium]